jgi:hypothetical protein
MHRITPAVNTIRSMTLDAPPVLKQVVSAPPPRSVPPALTPLSPARAPAFTASGSKMRTDPSRTDLIRRMFTSGPSSSSNPYFVRQSECTPEEIRKLEERFGDGFKAITFQPDGMCHTHVENVAKALAGQQSADMAVTPPKGPLMGAISNTVTPILSLVNNDSLQLSDVLRQGIPPGCAAVVIHASSGVADADSQMVESARKFQQIGEAPSGGANHSLAILHVDLAAGTAYVFDPDHARNSPKSEEMRTYCNDQKITPAQLPHQTIMEKGWMGELVRKVSAEELARKCAPRMVGGVIGIRRM